MERPDGLDEDELLAHLRGEAAPEASARIEARAAEDPALRAELALMAGLKDALAEPDAPPDRRADGWRALEAEIDRSTPANLPHRPFWRVAAMLLGAVVLLQGTYIALAPGTGGDPLYRTVSEDGAAFGLGVAFAPEATAAEIEALLRETGARIVDGPGAIGLYRLAFEDDAARRSALSALEASPLVDLVSQE